MINIIKLKRVVINSLATIRKLHNPQQILENTAKCTDSHILARLLLDDLYHNRVGLRVPNRNIAKTKCKT